MAIEQREGILDAVTEKGVILSGTRLSYSKWFEGDRPTEDVLGSKVQVVVDAGTKCTFLKRIVHIGEKAEGWKPPEPRNVGFHGGGGGRRFSPEELELERAKGVRIARSVALERAILLVESGLAVEEIASTVAVLEEYLLKGLLPKVEPRPKEEGLQKKIPRSPLAASSTPTNAAQSVIPPQSALQKEAPSPAPAKPKRLASRAVNALFNEALRGGSVDDWADFLQIVEDVLKVKGKSPYQLDIPSFERVASVVRAKLGRESAA